MGASNNLESLQAAKKETEEKLIAAQKQNEDLKGSMSKLEQKVLTMEADATSLQKRNQEAIGDKNKKLADLNAELNNIKSDLAATKSKSLSTEGKFEEMESNLSRKDAKV